MESIGCAKAGGKIELSRISEFFSDQCSQVECPQFNLCKQISETDLEERSVDVESR